MADLRFKDFPDFKPSYTPMQMFQMGVMGGFYFKIDTELPKQFLNDMSVDSAFSVNASDYENPTLNKYGVLAGTSLETWQKMGLMHPDDPNGWIEWYVKFYYGRRHADDARQIKRWKSFVARHTGMLIAYRAKGQESPKTMQNLLQWAFVE
jgi:hypothetical protein